MGKRAQNRKPNQPKKTRNLPRKVHRNSIKAIETKHWTNPSLSQETKIQNIIRDLKKFQEETGIDASYEIRKWKRKLVKAADPEYFHGQQKVREAA